MNTRFVEWLRRADENITRDEVADTLWLAAHLPAAVRADDRPPAAAAPAEISLAPPERTPAPPPDPAVAPAPERPVPEVSHRTTEVVDLTPGGSAAGLAIRSTAPAVEHVQVPGLAAVARELPLLRSLRMLRRRVPHRQIRVLDEVATADSSADAGTLCPVTVPATERWLDLVLVIDTAQSMEIWGRAPDDLRSLMARLGAFRTIHTVYLSSDPKAGDGVSLWTDSPDGRLHRTPEQLMGVVGRTVFLVFSDCIGERWSNGEVGPILELWGRASAVAVVQPMDEGLWDRCAIEVDRTTELWFGRPGQPNGAAMVKAPGSDGYLGTPVPVVQLDPEWLGAWAEAVAGTTPRWRPMAVIFTGGAARLEHPPVPQPDDALAQLAAFDLVASPTARTLAKYLAAAPLSLSTMRLVQRAMVAYSTPSDLAEVFLSGLLRRVDRSPSDDPDLCEYDFDPQVRRDLLSRLRRTDALRVLELVSELIRQRWGSPRSFAALIAAPSPADVLPPQCRPFAYLAGEVLHALGGSYTSMAGRLGYCPACPAPGDSAGNVDQDTQEFPEHEPDGVDNEAMPAAVGATMTAESVATMDTDVRPTHRPIVWGGLPPRNKHFTGREGTLRSVWEVLNNRDTAVLTHALHGLSGVGKTQIAAEYGYLYAADYDLVWWIPADEDWMIRRSFASLARRLKLPEAGDVEQTVDNVLDLLRSGTPYPHWLLIFDNATYSDEFMHYLPTMATGHVLITSRDPRWTEVSGTIEVDVFSERESIRLLTSRNRGVTESEAAELARQLGHLPLALDHAASWQSQTGMTTAEYLTLLRKRRARLLQEGKYGPGTASVAATYQVAFDSLREHSPGAAELLAVCAFLSTQPIAIPMLRRGGAAALQPPLDATLSDDFELYNAIRDITRFGLARQDVPRRTLQLHTVVAGVLQDHLRAQRGDDVEQIAQAVLGAANPGSPDDQTTWKGHAEIAPHVIAAGLLASENRRSRQAVIDQIRYLFLAGDYPHSRELAGAAVAEWRSRHGADDPLTLIACYHLGYLLRIVGDKDEARALNEETLQRMRATFGETDARTLLVENNAAADLRLLGDFAGARSLDEESLARHRDVFGPEAPETLRLANNLGVDLRLLGRFTEAHALDSNTVVQSAGATGEHSLQTLFCYSNLARDLYGVGRYAAAVDLQRAKLVPLERALPGNHHQVLLAKRNLAISLRKCGDYAGALALADEVRAITSERFGVRHEHSLAATMTYCSTLRVLGRGAEAVPLAEETVSRYQAAFGPGHPFTLAARVNLAIAQRAIGDAAAALRLNEATLSSLEQSLGPLHSYTLCCASSLANDLAALGEHDRARELSERTWQRSQEIRPARHPYALACAVNFAYDLRRTGEAQRGEELLEVTLEQIREVLGEDHPETAQIERGRRAESDIEPPPS